MKPWLHIQQNTDPDDGEKIYKSSFGNTLNYMLEHVSQTSQGGLAQSVTTWCQKYMSVPLESQKLILKSV